MRTTVTKFLLAGMACASLAGCNDNSVPQSPVAASPTEAAQSEPDTEIVAPVPAAGQTSASGGDATSGRRFAAWQGRWTGVEGMFLDLTALGDGNYRLAMQSDLDTRGTYQGTEAERSIRFEREGEKLSLRRSTGDETGLKWLAGKQDCLMVRKGEGYCRD